MADEIAPFRVRIVPGFRGTRCPGCSSVSPCDPDPDCELCGGKGWIEFKESPTMDATSELFPEPAIVFELFVPGLPKTKGSFQPLVSRHKAKKTGKHYVYMKESGTDDSRDARKAWTKIVTDSVWTAWDDEVGRKLDKGEAVSVSMLFLLPRPKTVKRKYPTSLMDGDVDKLSRLVLDALKKAGVYKDDSQVCDAPPSKRYAREDQAEGCLIKIEILS